MAKVMIASVYDAFRSAKVPDEMARSAAEDLAAYDTRFHGLERQIDQLDSKVTAVQTDLTWMKWILGANTAFVAGVLIKLLVQ